jgi:hypothetical protein
VRVKTTPAVVLIAGSESYCGGSCVRSLLPVAGSPAGRRHAHHAKYEDIVPDMPSISGGVRIVRSELGDDAPLLGAARLALRQAMRKAGT